MFTFTEPRFLALRDALQAVQNRPGHGVAAEPVTGALDEAELFRTAQGPYEGRGLGEGLKLVLNRLQLSLEGLANASQAVGLKLHSSTISRFKTAERGPTLYQLANLCPGLAAAAVNLGGAPEGAEGHAVTTAWVGAVVSRTLGEMWGEWPLVADPAADPAAEASLDVAQSDAETVGQDEAW